VRPAWKAAMRTATLLVVLALGAIAAGCGDAFSPEGVSGAYRLVRIRHHDLPETMALPVVCDSGGRVVNGTATLTSGYLDLTEDQRYVYMVERTFDAEPCPDAWTDTTSGRYALIDPSTIRLSETGTTYTWEGTVSGNTLTFHDPIDALFEKR